MRFVTTPNVNGFLLLFSYVHGRQIMNDRTREVPRTAAAAAERQMRSYEMAMAAETHRMPLPPHHATRIGPFVAISRETGAEGSEIAQEVACRLDWEVLDKSIVDRVAAACHRPKDMLQVVDETASSWVHDVLGTWLDSGVVAHEKYVAKLHRVVLAAARHGKVVMVGRGAGILLPRDAGLSVRIVAPLEFRVKHIMLEEHLDAARARDHIQQVDAGRRQFVRQYFHRDVEDPHLYDLLLNAEHLGRDGAVDIILTALAAKGLV
jgi:hypothetical protein